MEERTRCPACGAPLDLRGSIVTVRCNFCGTELTLREENGQSQFEVVSKPSPQAETLSEQARAEIEAVEEEASQALLTQEPRMDPAAPGVTMVAAGETELEDWQGSRLPETVTTIPEPPSRHAGEIGQPAGLDRRRWIWIGLTAFVVVCVLCACITTAVWNWFSIYSGGF